MLKEITIIIPLFNRYKEAIRLYNYFISLSSDIKIVILDNSIYPLENIKDVFSSRNLIYKIFPKETSYAQKLAIGINKYVFTEYAVICAQDDFLIIPAVNKCISFLKHNKDYSVCRGQTINFINDKKIANDIVFVKNQKLFSIDEDSPIKRLNIHLSNYTSTFYAIHRTIILKKI
ncbi:MAG: hypothetical protein Kow0068_10120 [Marinilabiliales bacterium]